MNILAELSHSHHELDLLLLDLRAQVQGMTGLDPHDAQRLLTTARQLRAVAAVHARFEEEQVFPALRGLVGPEHEGLRALTAQHEALLAQIDFLEDGARGVVQEGRLLDIEAARAHVEALIRSFDAHGAAEAALLDTTANLLRPCEAGGA